MRARVFFALLMFVTLAGSALADDRRDALSLDRVLPEIRRSTPGTFYDAEGPFFTPDGQARYRIKWMTPDGRIIWFEADARTGRVVGGGGFMPPPHFRDDGYPRGDRGWGPGNERGRGGDWGHGDWGHGGHGHDGDGGRDHHHGG